jgi:phage gp29-like protein
MANILSRIFKQKEIPEAASPSDNFSSPAPDNLTTQIVDISSSMRSIIGYLDDTNSWLSSVGESQEVFTKMMNDPKIESLIGNRNDRVQQMYGSITDSGNAVVDNACREHLTFNLLYKLNTILLNAIPYGIALCEIIWEKKGNLYVPVGFTPIPRTSINFPKQGGDFGVPYLSALNKPLNEPYKFIIHRNDKGDGNLWGTPALRSCYWPWKFKQLGFRFWIQAAERLGVPSILAIFETKNAEDAQRRSEELTNLIRNMKSGSSGALANIKEIKVVEGAIKDFETIVKVCNEEISYGITAQALMTSQAEYGTKSQGELHSETYGYTTTHDAYLIQQSDQLLFKYFVEVNFPGAAVPIYDIDSTDFADWSVIREAIDRNVPVSLKALYEKVHIPKPENEADTFVKPASSSSMFADNTKDSFFLRTGNRG